TNFQVKLWSEHWLNNWVDRSALQGSAPLHIASHSVAVRVRQPTLDCRDCYHSLYQYQHFYFRNSQNNCPLRTLHSIPSTNQCADDDAAERWHLLCHSPTLIVLAQ